MLTQYTYIYNMVFSCIEMWFVFLKMPPVCIYKTHYFFST